MIDISMLPEKTNDQDLKIYRYMSRVVGGELANLSKPCYYPKLIRYWKDLQKITEIDDNALKQFKNTALGPEFPVIKIFQDKFTMLLVMNMIYYARKGKEEISKLFYQLLAIKFHSSYVHKLFPVYCNSDAWNLALDNVSIKHLYKVHKGIQNTLFYIVDTENKKYGQYLKSPQLLSDFLLVRLIQYLRNRIAQSARSFAETYYRIMEEMKSGATKQTGADVADIQLIADKMSMMICTYGQIDKDALTRSINRSGIRKELCLSIISGISDPDFKDKVRFILILIGRIRDIRDVCVETSRNFLIRKIESNVKIAGRYSVRDEIIELLDGLEISYQLRTINESQKILFLSNYFTLYLQNRICS